MTGPEYGGQREGIVITAAERAQISRALDAAFERAGSGNGGAATGTLDLAADRYIIFSDLHRGARNGADDFWRAERAYNAALAYYLRKGHTLVVLGDVEELWEERPWPVLKAYGHTFALEARFHQQGRYYRVRGNHDDEWQYARRVKRRLGKLYGPPELVVYESLLLEVVEGGELLGRLFLIHGHQGTSESDRFASLARQFVRYIWRPVQRLTHWSFNTPATTWRLRQKHNRLLYNWAESRSGLVLIAGHTHRPVFGSESHEAQLLAQLAELETVAGGEASPEQLEEQAVVLAELEWVRAQEAQVPKAANEPPPTKPCYFNTGCCCFSDGDITGLEIAGGEIRLVRWPDQARDPRPHVLARGSLRDVLAAC